MRHPHTDFDDRNLKSNNNESWNEVEVQQNETTKR